MRYFVELAYHGGAYSGWQGQKNAIGIQQVVSESLSKILRQPIEIVGSGRTDAGVHALGQVAHFDYDKFLPQDFVYKFNAVLPDDISVRDCYRVVDDAHARFSALSRSYRYLISREKDPFHREVSWLFVGQLDVEAMQKAAQYLIGLHDFTAVSKLKKGEENHHCHIFQAEWIEQKGKIYFDITANRFLWRMVRLLVGGMVEVGRGKMQPTDFYDIILNKERGKLDNAAPAQGLFLTKIHYESKIKIK